MMTELINEFTSEQKIAYFSMEVGLKSNMPTYSGGLGILAGDTLKSAADLALPVVAVTILTKKGYFKQDLDIYGRQNEYAEEWNPAEFMTIMPYRTTVKIEGRNVQVAPWLYVIESAAGGKVPVLFLDTDLPENSEQDRSITHHLYGGDETYRLKQEIVLGIGGF